MYIKFTFCLALMEVKPDYNSNIRPKFEHKQTQVLVKKISAYIAIHLRQIHHNNDNQHKRLLDEHSFFALCWRKNDLFNDWVNLVMNHNFSLLFYSVVSLLNFSVFCTFIYNSERFQSYHCCIVIVLLILYSTHGISMDFHTCLKIFTLI